MHRSWKGGSWRGCFGGGRERDQPGGGGELEEAARGGVFKLGGGTDAQRFQRLDIAPAQGVLADQQQRRVRDQGVAHVGQTRHQLGADQQAGQVVLQRLRRQ